MAFTYKQFYERKLPHRHSHGSTLFVTFRIKGSVPRNVIEQWKAEKARIEAVTSQALAPAPARTETAANEDHERLLNFHRRWFARYEEVLHTEKHGPVWLKEPSIAELVANAFHYLDGQSYRLHAYAVMSNHAHVVFTPFLDELSIIETRRAGRPIFISHHPTLAAIMRSIKGYTAREANKILNRRGQFWEPESYDHEVRDQNEFWRIINYTLKNPVKAGLVRDWRDWPFSWVDDRLGYSSLTETTG